MSSTAPQIVPSARATIPSRDTDRADGTGKAAGAFSSLLEGLAPAAIQKKANPTDAEAHGDPGATRQPRKTGEKSDGNDLAGVLAVTPEPAKVATEATTQAGVAREPAPAEPPDTNTVAPPDAVTAISRQARAEAGSSTQAPPESPSGGSLPTTLSPTSPENSDGKPTPIPRAPNDLVPVSEPVHQLPSKPQRARDAEADPVQNAKPTPPTADGGRNEVVIQRAAGQTVPAAAKGADPKHAGHRESEGLKEARSSHGMSSAQSSDQMKNAQHQTTLAGASRQLLPDTVTVAVRGQGLDEPLALQRPDHRPGVPNSHGVNLTVEGLRSGESPALDEGPSITLERSTLDRVNQLILREVNTVRQTSARELDVVLRPDSRTEIALHVQWRHGQLIADARCLHGDYTALNSGWMDLQAHLGREGVHLTPLEQPASPTGSNASGNSNSHQSQSQETWQNDAAAGDQSRPASSSSSPVRRTGFRPVRVDGRQLPLLESWA